MCGGQRTTYSSRAQTQLVRLSGNQLYPLSHLTLLCFLLDSIETGLGCDPVVELVCAKLKVPPLALQTWGIVQGSVVLQSQCFGD